MSAKFVYLFSVMTIIGAAIIKDNTDDPDCPRGRYFKIGCSECSCFRGEIGCTSIACPGEEHLQKRSVDVQTTEEMKTVLNEGAEATTRAWWIGKIPRVRRAVAVLAAEIPEVKSVPLSEEEADSEADETPAKSTESISKESMEKRAIGSIGKVISETIDKSESSEVVDDDVTEPVLEPSAHDDPLCPEGPVFMRSCNTCICRNGQSICTLRGCLVAKPSFPIAKPALNRESLEESQEEFDSDHKMEELTALNDKSSKVMDAEMIAAAEGEQMQPLKRQGFSTIAEVGQHEMAEEEFPGRSAMPEDLLCPRGRSFKSGCNACSCSQGRTVCTPLPCQSELEISELEQFQQLQHHNRPEQAQIAVQPQGVCTHGSYGINGCNRCYCNHGAWQCTQMDCQGVQRSSFTASTCEEGSSYRLGCNICSCLNGAIACTTAGCSVDSQTL